MIFKSKTVKPWTKEDYARTIIHFFVQALILTAIYLVAVVLNNGGISGVDEYFSSSEMNMKFIYLTISMLFLLAMLYLYLYFEYRDFLKENKNILLLFMILEFTLIVNFLIGKYVNIYARPLSFCALLVLLLVNRRVSIMMNLTSCILLFMMDVFTVNTVTYGHEIYSSMFIGITTGLLSIYLVSNVSSRVKVFFMGLFISLPIMACILCLEFFNTDKIIPLMAYGFTSGMLSVVFMMATLPFFEQAFNMITDYRLSEITDHKSKLISQLMAKAPGTFNHSHTLSTLAESCAIAIGENALLARAAAYYHDIGKLKQPEYFTENQSGVNPHNELSPELSTDIIRAHTKDGYDLITKYHLPKILADIALEHHGTLPIKYFYAKALQYTDGELDIADFSYIGPRPQSKISAIIMICDGCEAAVRSLSERSQEKVDDMVKKIIEERMDLEQFNESDLTMRDIDIIRSTISQSLGGVYHDRVKYPKLKIGRVKKSANAKKETKKD